MILYFTCLNNNMLISMFFWLQLLPTFWSWETWMAWTNPTVSRSNPSRSRKNTDIEDMLLISCLITNVCLIFFVTIKQTCICFWIIIRGCDPRMYIQRKETDFLRVPLFSMEVFNKHVYVFAQIIFVKDYVK